MYGEITDIHVTEKQERFRAAQHRKQERQNPHVKNTELHILQSLRKQDTTVDILQLEAGL